MSDLSANEQREKNMKGNFAVNEAKKASRAIDAVMDALDGYLGWENLFFQAEDLSMKIDRLINDIRRSG